MRSVAVVGALIATIVGWGAPLWGDVGWPFVASPPPLVVAAVSSCTGRQGAAFLNALLASRGLGNAAPLRLRCMSRAPASGATRRLAAAGVTVVPATAGSDPTDAEMDALLRGTTALFLVTFSQFGSAGAEVALAGRWAVAARRHRLQQLILSGGARTGIPELDAKSEAEARLRRLDAPFNTLFLHSSFFYENLISKGGEPRLGACQLQVGGGSGVRSQTAVASVTFTNPLPPDKPIVMHAAADLGRAAAAAVLDPARFKPGEAVRVVGARCTPAQFAAAYGNVSGVTSRYVQMDVGKLQREVFANDPATGAAVAKMYQAYLASSLLKSDATMNVDAVRARFSEAAGLHKWMVGEGTSLVAATCTKMHV